MLSTVQEASVPVIPDTKLPHLLGVFIQVHFVLERTLTNTEPKNPIPKNLINAPFSSGILLYIIIYIYYILYYMEYFIALTYFWSGFKPSAVRMCPTSV